MTLPTVLPDMKVTVNGRECPVLDGYGSFRICRTIASGNETFDVSVEAEPTLVRPRVSPLRDHAAVEVENGRTVVRFDGAGYRVVRSDNHPPLLLLFDPPCAPPTDPVDAAALGVIPDPERVQTTTLQAAINSVAGDGGGTLRLTRGIYRSGSLRLPSGFTLHLDEGAVLKASDRLEDLTRDPLPGPYNRRVFVSAVDAVDVAIRGEGWIDGNGTVLREQAGRGATVRARFGEVDAERVVNLLFARCRGVRVEGMFCVNSSSWNTVPYFCDDVVFDRVKLLGNMRCKNDDAIDPDSCVDLTLRNSFLMARDDAVVLKTCGTVDGVPISPDGGSRDMSGIRVENNLLWSGTAAMKYGYNESEASDVSDVRFERNVVVHTREGVQFMAASDARIHGFEFRANHYEECTERNYWLCEPSARDMRFVDEVHEGFGRERNVALGGPHRFERLRIGGEEVRSMEEGRFEGDPEMVGFA